MLSSAHLTLAPTPFGTDLRKDCFFFLFLQRKNIVLFYLVGTRYFKAVVAMLVSIQATHGSGGISIAAYKDQ